MILYALNFYRFEAHRIVLAASSEYFHKMFSNHFKESREREIRFNLEAESLKIVIDYIYSGKIGDIFILLNTERLLQFHYSLYYSKFI